MARKIGSEASGSTPAALNAAALYVVTTAIAIFSDGR